MELPILYRKSSKGKTQQWKVWTEDNVIFTEYGVKEGKLQTTSKAVQGKNIGRANETTPKYQAEAEAQSMWQKRVDGKYRQTLEETEEIVFLPMLAHDFTKQKTPIEYPIDVQPKLDGVRCMAFRMDGEVHLMSRGGKEYDVAHIKKELERIIPERTVLDGELYVHGIPLQDVIRLVKKHRDGEDGSIRLQFRIFDALSPDTPEEPWRSRRDERLNQVDDEIEEANTVNHLFVVSTEEIQNETQLYELLAKYESQGYEGIIIRKLEGVYRLGHRSRDLLKLKNFQDAEFEIVGFTHGSGRDEHAVVWTCKTEDGKEFNARPTGTREEREQWFIEGESFIGKLLTVKYQALTKDGIPQFPVGMAVRDYE